MRYLNQRKQVVVSAVVGAALAVLTVPGWVAESRAGIPRDAKYTILLLDFPEVDHIPRSKKVMEQLKKATGLSDYFLVHEEKESILYYGGYTAIDSKENPDESKRYKADLNRLITMNVEGSSPFRSCFGTLLPLPNPEAPKEWDITNSDGVYSLEIGVYKDSAERKQAAVDTVRQLRKQDVEAYFYHGPAASSVLIGSFKADAIRLIHNESKAKPGQELLVVPYKPEGMPDDVEQADGTMGHVVAPDQMEIVDPMLKSILTHPEYREHFVNGEARMRTMMDSATGKKIEQLDPSILVDIGKLKTQTSLSVRHSGGDSAASPDLMPKPTQTPGAGKLKSVGN